MKANSLRILWQAASALVLICGLSSALAAVPSRVHLTGTMGKNLAVEMDLALDAGQVSGSYFYVKHHQSIPLQGQLDGGRGLKLDEFGQPGSKTGTFEGTLEDGGLYTGTWTSRDGAKKLPFALQQADGSGAASGTDVAAGAGDSAPAAAGTGGPWEGQWTRAGDNQFNSSVLTVSGQTAGSFSFVLDTNSGGHIGRVEGEAKLQGTTAEFRGSDNPCVMKFHLVDEMIGIKSDQCDYYAGAGVYFDGAYTQEADEEKVQDLHDLGILETEQQDAAFRQMTGEGYELFQNCFQLTNPEDDLDGFGAKITSGGVKGLFTIQEGIILVTPAGKMWAAAIDPGTDEVKSWTNDPAWAAKLPKTIEKWRERFQEKKVLYLSKG